MLTFMKRTTIIIIVCQVSISIEEIFITLGLLVLLESDPVWSFYFPTVNLNSQRHISG